MGLVERVQAIQEYDVEEAFASDVERHKNRDQVLDADSDPADPRWFVVDVGYVAQMKVTVTRDMMKENEKLEDMMLLQRGSRLSVQPVAKEEWREILKMGGQKESW